MTETPARLPVRMPRLDGLRGIAILLVLFHQLDRIGGRDLASRLIERSFDLGWIGVQLFFVLSGFLISGILLDSRGRPGAWRDFLARRALRIFPLYYGALVLLLVVLPALGVTPPGFREHSLWYWLYLSNWTQPYQGGSLPHFWSLAVEEQFYLVWPLVALRCSPNQLLRVCVGVAIAGLLLRIGMVAAAVDREAIYMSSLSRMDALALGGAVAAWLRLPGRMDRAVEWRRRVWWLAVGLGAVGLVGTGFYPRTAPLGQTVGYSVLAATFALAILALVADDAAADRSRRTSWLALPLLRMLGLYSYGMYVFHKPLHDLVGKPLLSFLGYPALLPTPLGVAYVAGGILAVTAAGAASYWLFERRFLALRARFPAARAAAG